MQHSKDKFKVGYLLDPNLNQVGSHYVCILIFLYQKELDPQYWKVCIADCAHFW